MRFTRLRRLPIRVRLALAFTVAMALVLGIVGFFVYEGVSGAVDRSIDSGLTARAGDITALVRQADSGLRQGGGAVLGDQDESFAQVLDYDGRIFDSTPQLADKAILSRVQLGQAVAGATFFDGVLIPGMEDPARLLAVPTVAQDRGLVVVVGASLEGREETLSQLFTRLSVWGPVALLLSSFLAYVLATAALRPVELMRREASAISAAEPGRRLPVPEARDELARLSTTLNEMLARLEAAMETERTFVSDASHELRTPLSLLKTELELALAQKRSTAELEEALRSAAFETDRLTQLAEDLLVLARADQGRLQIRSEEIDIRRILEGVRDRFALRAGDLERDLTVAAPPSFVVRVDRLRMEQALSNIVDNALRHGEGTVELQAEEVEGSLEVHVLDEGPGFPAEFIPRAFERFARDESRSERGAGLGLAIAAAIAESHGGSMRVGNRDSGGADVCMFLPA